MQIELNPKDLPGFISYKDNITSNDLDQLRIKIEKMKQNAKEMEKQMIILNEMKIKGQKQFEK